MGSKFQKPGADIDEALAVEPIAATETHRARQHGGAPPVLPTNAFRGQAYRGINTLISVGECASATAMHQANVNAAPVVRERRTRAQE